MSKNLKLVAVTKGRTVPEILKMLKLTGAKCIGENRLKEAKDKLPELMSELKKTGAKIEIEKHFIGKLQSRKIPQIVQLFDVIQSVENLKQAKRISECGKQIKIMLQVNISGLSQRGGAKPKETEKLIEEIKKLPNIELIGVMGLASQDPEKAKKEFHLLKSLQGNLQECSMGMSEDWQTAVKEGSTMLRIGRLLFEENLPSLPSFQ